MLTVWEAIKTRRRIRKFAPDDVSDELVGQLLEAARLAPSGSNRQPWRFLIVRDIETKKELRRICADQRFIEEAPVVIVCFGDMERYSQQATRERWQEFVDSGTIATLPGRLSEPEYLLKLWTSSPSPTGRPLLISAIANTYIAITHIVLMATASGLCTCWVGGFTDPSEFNRLFGLSENLVPVAVVPIGYPTSKIPPPRPRLSLEEILLKTKI